MDFKELLDSTETLMSSHPFLATTLGTVFGSVLGAIAATIFDFKKHFTNIDTKLKIGKTKDHSVAVIGNHNQIHLDPSLDELPTLAEITRSKEPRLLDANQDALVTTAKSFGQTQLTGQPTLDLDFRDKYIQGIKCLNSGVEEEAMLYFVPIFNSISAHSKVSAERKNVAYKWEEFTALADALKRLSELDSVDGSQVRSQVQSCEKSARLFLILLSS